MRSSSVRGFGNLMTSQLQHQQMPPFRNQSKHRKIARQMYMKLLKAIVKQCKMKRNFTRTTLKIWALCWKSVLCERETVKRGICEGAMRNKRYRCDFFTKIASYISPCSFADAVFRHVSFAEDALPLVFCLPRGLLVPQWDDNNDCSVQWDKHNLRVIVE